MNNSISILLGAGFSAPKGYPVGNTLNEKLLNCTGEEFSFHTSGQLVVSTDGKKPDFGFKTSYDNEFDFCKVLIQYFNEQKGYFDYEEFYDFIKEEAINDEKVEELAQPFLGEAGNKELLIPSLDNIYTQLIAYYLKDSEGKTYYDDEGFMCGPIFPGYTGILDCLKEMSTSNIINVHTLNHDLFFERLNQSEWISGQLCDGFEELGSPYYGTLNNNGHIYRARLERYTGNYDNKFRLYKLHGSKDYGMYFSTQGTVASPENYIKTRYGIGFGELIKERIDKKGKLYYEDCWFNYHADFLTGTTSKIERYKEPLLFKTLFELFRQNLTIADKLIIIGYGGKDAEINRMLLENFDYKNKPSFIIDLYAGEQVQSLSSQLNASLIKKTLDSIKFSDLGI